MKHLKLQLNPIINNAIISAPYGLPTFRFVRTAFLVCHVPCFISHLEFKRYSTFAMRNNRTDLLQFITLNTLWQLRHILPVSEGLIRSSGLPQNRHPEDLKHVFIRSVPPIDHPVRWCQFNHQNPILLPFIKVLMAGY